MNYHSPVDPAAARYTNAPTASADVAALTEPSIDTALSVNETVARYPATMAVFNRFGVDTCCGGGASIAEAAVRDGIAIDGLVEELRRAVKGS